MFMEGGGALEIALRLETALGLVCAELFPGFLELTGEPLAVHAARSEFPWSNRSGARLRRSTDPRTES
jgi:hypothetical protein